MNEQNRIIQWVTTHKNTLIYWIATLWLALGMISTGIVQLIKEPATVAFMTEAGYPLYFLTMLGIGKVLGVIVLLIPKFPILKEWAYAGLFYIVAGAAYTYVALGNFGDLYHLVLLFVLIIISRHFRPASRKIS